MSLSAHTENRMSPGHSGSGKTLYAESLAKACQLGLFKVGTDIGLEVAHAERRLRDIFELAESWNTVLLMSVVEEFLIKSILTWHTATRRMCCLTHGARKMKALCPRMPWSRVNYPSTRHYALLLN